MSRQSFKPVILVTRPEPQAARFCSELRDYLGGEIEVINSPVMQVAFRTVSLPQRGFVALVLTSETSVKALARWKTASNTLPGFAYCVGDHTADSARNFGLEVLSAQGGAVDLLELIKNHPPLGPILFVRGADSAGDLAKQLRLAGIETDELIAYHQEPLPLSAAALQRLNAASAIVAPVFSPRSAALLATELGESGLQTPIVVVAMSDAVVKAALALNPIRTVVAPSMDGKGMLIAIAEEVLRNTAP